MFQDGASGTDGRISTVAAAVSFRMCWLGFCFRTITWAYILNFPRLSPTLAEGSHVRSLHIKGLKSGQQNTMKKFYVVWIKLSLNKENNNYEKVTLKHILSKLLYFKKWLNCKHPDMRVGWRGVRRSCYPQKGSTSVPSHLSAVRRAVTRHLRH